MQLLVLQALLCLAPLVRARLVKQGSFVEQTVIKIPAEQLEPQYLIEFANGSSKWVTHAAKWQLKTVCTVQDFVS